MADHSNWRSKTKDLIHKDFETNKYFKHGLLYEPEAI